MPNKWQMRYSAPADQRFTAMVDRTDGCWLANRAVLNTHGYAMFTIAAGIRPVRAHRYAWEQANGGPVPNGMVVRHLCEANYPVGDITYRRCVRPEHLAIGTPKDNSDDAVASGRLAVGDRHGQRVHPEKRRRGVQWHQAVLTDELVVQILEMAANRMRIVDIAHTLGVNRATISDVTRGKTWTHIPRDITSRSDQSQATCPPGPLDQSLRSNCRPR